MRPPPPPLDPCRTRQASAAALRRWRVVTFLLPICLMLWGARPVEAADSSTKSVFSGFESAWEAASAAKVTALMEAKGKLRVQLLRPKAGGTWTADQARRALVTYFGARGVSDPKLKHVVPKGKKQKADKTVRVYDYTYRPHGGDRRTTRLTVTVKKDAKKRWVLASVTESPKQ